MSSTPEVRHLTREQRAVLARIQQICEYWDITPAELTSPLREPAPEPAPPPMERRVKYRHPVSGETWDGQGPQPEWLRRALLQEGFRVAELVPDEPLRHD